MFAFSRDLASKELKPVFQAFLRRNKDKNKEVENCALFAVAGFFSNWSGQLVEK